MRCGQGRPNARAGARRSVDARLPGFLFSRPVTVTARVRCAHASARSTSRSAAAPRASGPSRSPAHRRPDSSVRRWSRRRFQRVAVSSQQRSRGDELLAVLLRRQTPATRCGRAAYHSPATTGSRPQCVGPSTPRNTIPPHPAAITSNADTTTPPRGHACAPRGSTADPTLPRWPDDLDGSNVCRSPEPRAGDQGADLAIGWVIGDQPRPGYMNRRTRPKSPARPRRIIAERSRSGGTGVLVAVAAHPPGRRVRGPRVPRTSPATMALLGELEPLRPRDREARWFSGLCCGGLGTLARIRHTSGLRRSRRQPDLDAFSHSAPVPAPSRLSSS